MPFAIRLKSEVKSLRGWIEQASHHREWWWQQREQQERKGNIREIKREKSGGGSDGERERREKRMVAVAWWLGYHMEEGSKPFALIYRIYYRLFGTQLNPSAINHRDAHVVDTMAHHQINFMRMVGLHIYS